MGLNLKSNFFAMKKIVSLLVATVFSVSFLYAQHLQTDWVARVGGSLQDEIADICVDDTGNSYSTGWYYGTSDFDPGISSLNHSSNGEADAFILKMDSSGSLLWCKVIGDIGADAGYQICLDNDGNILVAGFFSNTVDLNPGISYNPFTSNGSWDVFVLKLDPFGNYIWAKTFGSVETDRVEYIHIDPNNNVLIGGRFLGTLDLDPGAGVQSHTSSGWFDAYILKLDPMGEYIWSRTFGGYNGDHCYSIATDALGNVYSTGSFSETVDFDPSMYAFNLTAVGLSDIFLLKYTPAGNLVWAKQMGGQGYDTAFRLLMDSTGHFCVTGRYESTMDAAPDTSIVEITSQGGEDLFITKLDTSGTLLWAKSIGGPGDEVGLGLCYGSAGDVFITGSFEDTVDFNPDTSSTQFLVSKGEKDFFVSKLDQAGNLVWAKGYGGINDDGTYAIHTDVYDNVYVAGDFKNQVNFMEATSQYVYSSYGQQDAFLMKLFPCTSTSSTVFDTACVAYDFNGTILDTTGIYGFTVLNSAGCDSFINLHLTILYPDTTELYETSCGPFEFYGNTLTASGDYLLNVPNSSVCDSVFDLHLTVHTIDTSVMKNGNSLTANEADAIYQWIDCGNGNTPVPGATTQSYSSDTIGSFAVVITKNGCTDTSTCKTIGYIGIDQVNVSSNIRVFPNPAKDRLCISLDERFLNGEVEVFNAFGQKLLYQDLFTKETSISLSSLPKGMYLLRISLHNRILHSQKIRIE